MLITKEQWEQVMMELIESKCAFCARCCPYKKRYIQIRHYYGKFYFTDAFCSSCYKLYLEGFPWSASLDEIPFVYRVPRSFDIADLEYY